MTTTTTTSRTAVCTPVNGAQLKALLTHCGKEPTRLAITGIEVNTTEGTLGWAKLQATDGRRAAILETARLEQPSTDKLHIHGIIPAATLKSLKTTANVTHQITLVLPDDAPDSGRVQAVSATITTTLRDGSTSTTQVSIDQDATFPTMDDVIPALESGIDKRAICGGINPDFLADAAKLCKTCSDEGNQGLRMQWPSRSREVCGILQPTSPYRMDGESESSAWKATAIIMPITLG